MPPPSREERQQQAIHDLVKAVVKELIQSKEHRDERKDIFKEAIRELIQEQQAAVGRWSIRFVVLALTSVVLYTYFRIKGFI